jgi:hypothetical protein
MKGEKVLFIIAITIILLVCFFGGLYVLGTQGEPYKFAVKFIDDRTLEA